ncbi:hypothetical protein MRB53_017216 [Persea americana]|uniref:Uncharacterized protein n=1 Tax=Persea americana TaxID=3435 RepID=A0ACC2M4D5_PERAE|nr:hypothetical protein MRB53_017216 [Persea americana]
MVFEPLTLSKLALTFHCARGYLIVLNSLSPFHHSRSKPSPLENQVASKLFVFLVQSSPYQVFNAQSFDCLVDLLDSMLNLGVFCSRLREGITSSSLMKG